MIVEMAYVQLWLEGSGPQLIVTSLSCWGASLKLLVAILLADSKVLADFAGSKSILMTCMTGLSKKPMLTEYILPSEGQPPVPGGILGEFWPKQLWGCLEEPAFMVLCLGHQVLVVLFEYLCSP